MILLYNSINFPNRLHNGIGVPFYPVWEEL